MFCTRWNGLTKGSVFDDALDDKEFEGNLIYLLQNGSDFIRNNSKVRFEKKARYRVDKPDYAERAVTEALVNALMIAKTEVPVNQFFMERRSLHRASIGKETRLSHRKSRIYTGEGVLHCKNRELAFCSEETGRKTGKWDSKTRENREVSRKEYAADSDPCYDHGYGTGGIFLK